MPDLRYRPLPLLSRAWLGLDCGPAVPRVAWVRAVCGRWRVQTWVWSDTPAALRRRALEGGRCAAALPPQAGLVVRLQPPELPPARRRRVLPALLDMQLPFAADACACAYHDGPEGALGFAARQADIAAALAELQAQGTNPERLAPTGWVLWTQAAREFPVVDDTSRRAVLHAAGAHLTVVAGQGRRFGSVAVLPGCSSEALQRVLRLAFPGADGALLVVCAGADAATLAREAASLTLPWPLRVLTAEAPEGFLARALAVDALDDAAGGRDLRRGPLAHPRRARTVRRALHGLLAAAAVGAGVLLAAALGTRHTIAAREAALADRLAETLTRVAGYRVVTRGERALQEAREALSARLDPRVERLRTPRAARELLALLTTAEQEGVTLMHLDVGDEGLRLSGNAPDPVHAAAFAGSLRAQGLAVRLEADPQPAPDGRTLFLMTPETDR